MSSKVEVKCKQCKSLFIARVADRKRGWGKFCSKSCKAKKQVKTIPFNRDKYESYLQDAWYVDVNDVDDEECLGGIVIEQDYIWTNH